MEKIKFPERLDKLDTTIAGIMSAVQSIQYRLDIVERNLSDKLRDMYDYQKETKKSLQIKLDQYQADIKTFIDISFKKQQSLTYVTWSLIIVLIIFSFILKKYF